MELGSDPLSSAESSTHDLDESMMGGRVGQFMSLQDQNVLRQFVKDFSGRILQHLEAVLRKLNESVS